MDAIADAKSIMLQEFTSEMYISRTHQGYRAVRPDQKHYGTVMGVVHRDTVLADLLS
jgi:hypothetical protein